MLETIVQRALVALTALLVSSAAVFALINSAVDPATAIAGADASAESVEIIRRNLGLDQSLVVQYVQWLGRAFLGDFGLSYRVNRPVGELVMQSFVITLTLGASALLLGGVLGIGLGVTAALRRGSFHDRAVLLFSTIGQAVPAFWLALMLVVVFSVNLRWLPVSGYGTIAHAVLPVAVLCLITIPPVIRLSRSAMIEVMESDYIRAARAKGLGITYIVLHHALRNALGPVLSLSAVQLGVLLSGSVAIETVFSINGIGFLAWQSVQRADIPVIQAIVFLLSVIYLALIVVGDLVNSALDPRTRR